ncbi:zonular occludens toxin domain-containing protein [Collimonas fungivorans]|uniref:zonular occludens toxin domain-containing protein n=1 Tax=Collimonas fungivorans TaxID=158899 RepID=UPI000680C008|nr:zonular occludens toxin domain-containing protein [Collimonas fungivorans]
MADYLVYGKKGSGKSLVVVGRIKDALLAGKKVATNLNLKLDKLLPIGTRGVICYRLPDRPTIEDMEAIGIGSDKLDEATYGLVVLDEMATWMNSRSWADKGRQALLDWFVHSRKMRWDSYMLCQSPNQIDKQVRESLVEQTVACKRLDKIRIPFLGALTKHFFGVELRAPKIHLAIVKYGVGNDAVLSDRWTYRGKNLYAAYDTEQKFSPTYSDGIFSYLSPWHVAGRYCKLSMGWRDYIKRFFNPAPSRLPAKPLHPVARLVSQLPASERVRHFQRLEQLGAFK